MLFRSFGNYLSTTAALSTNAWRLEVLRMKVIEQEFIKVVHSEDPSEFEAKYNDAMKSLFGMEVQVDLDTAREKGFLAYLRYKVKSKVPESIRDEYELDGKAYYCKDCPFFKRGKNKACRSAGCSKDIIRNAVDFTCACDTFYELLKEGKIEANE